KRCSMAGRGSRLERSRGSNALKLGDCPFVGYVSGVQSGFRFNQDDVDFFVGDGTMFDAARDDDKFPFVDDGLVAAKLHAQAPFDDQKKLVFVVMMMPDKVALELDGFEIA